MMKSIKSTFLQIVVDEDRCTLGPLISECMDRENHLSHSVYYKAAIYTKNPKK